MKIFLSLLSVIMLSCLSPLSLVMAGSDQPTLQTITFTRVAPDQVMIIFQLNGTYIPKTFAIKGKKPRVVFDFYGVGPAPGLPSSIEAGGQFIERIRIGRHEGDPPKTRVVFDLLPDRKIRFKQDFDSEHNTLTIAVLPAKKNEISVIQAKNPEKANPPARPVPLQRHQHSENGGKQPEKHNPTHLKQTRRDLKTKTAANHSPAVRQEKIPDAGTERVPGAQQQETAQQKNQDHAQPRRDLKTKTPANHSPAVRQEKIPDAGTERVPGAQQQETAQQKNQAPVSESAPPTSQAKMAPGATSPSQIGIKKAVLQSIVFDNNSSRGEMIQFTLTDFHPPKIFGIEEGRPRVVCDFPATITGKNLPAQIKADGRWVRQIRIGSHRNPDRVRAVIDLSPNHNYDLQQVYFTEENLFVIIVNTVNKQSRKSRP